MDEHLTTTHSELIGTTIGNYRVLALLGEGGMGSVYLAEHPVLGKKVALKVLHEELAANRDLVERFLTEARALTHIGHPNIVEILDLGTGVRPSGGGLVYYIMEYLAGESLAAIIDAQAPLPEARAVRIGAQIADALAASHSKGIVHRDLKPDNVFLFERSGQRDCVKLLDFGIAKLVGSAAGANKTRTGVVLGTPGYMSPEQCEGKPNIDHRSDIYALGIVIYEMLTRKRPFRGSGLGEILLQQLTKPPARPRTLVGPISLPIEDAIMKALEQAPERRFETMAQFRDALSGKGRAPLARASAAAAAATNAAPSAETGFAKTMAATSVQAPQGRRAVALSGPALRLERWMCDRQKWELAAFRTSLIEHPLYRELVPCLLWTTLDDHNRTVTEFRVRDTGTFADRDDKTITIGAKARVGLPHPIELSPKVIEVWLRVFAEFEIEQPLLQLGRTIHRIGEGEKLATTLMRVAEIEVSLAELERQKKRGWEWQDSGTFARPLPGGKFHAFLTVHPGSSPDSQRLGGVSLRQVEATKPSRTVTFGMLDPIAFSELVLDLRGMVG